MVWKTQYSVQAEYSTIKDFVKYLRADPETKKIGAAGFCWGGWSTVQLTHPGDVFVDAAVSCHPGFLSIPDDVEKCNKPLLIQVGEFDEFLPPEHRSKCQEVFKNKPDCAIDIYEGQVHGFAARGDLTVEKDRKAKEQVAEKVLFLSRGRTLIIRLSTSSNSI